jgi:predicted site-specific integrase-resolvase
MSLPNTYTVAEVAASLGVSEWWVRDQSKKGTVVPLRVGTHRHARMRFTDEHVAQLVASLTPAPLAPTRKRRRRVA